MNIKVANRLVELRKKSGLSQEQLADKLGLSRQAVSKWERAEASPDTDNLICLAKIYNVSLDELLSTDQTVEDIALENKDKEEEKKEKKEEEKKPKTKLEIANIIISSVLGAITIITYIILGVLIPSTWKVAWVLFLLVPTISSLLEAIDKKRVSSFFIPMPITAVYCFIGIQYGLWHPYWVLWLLIPLFYAISDPIDKVLHKED